MKKIMVAGNWKMNTDIKAANDLAVPIVQQARRYDKQNLQVLLCPPFTNLQSVASITNNSPVFLGAQNCHYEEKGAYTGEISVSMIKSLGCSHIIIGHSERRAIFGEDDEFINKKLHTILDAGLIPVICIGETLEERNDNKTFEVLKKQLDKGLAGLYASAADKIVVAYEPVWAIGTGVAATADQVDEAHTWIRNYLTNTYGPIANEIIILYGGSVNDKNASEIFSIKDVNGGLIGGASLKSDIFNTIIKTAEELVK